MNKNIIFIGGIHGVGKGTLCENIKSFNDIKHLSASELLKWSDLNTDVSNKKVLNINSTQQRFILGLKQSVNANEKYILDGHFCLLTKKETIERVPYTIFKKIDPLAIILVTEDPQIICERLSNRDNKVYDADILDKMQNEERIYANEICEKLSLELLEIKSNQIDLAVSFLMRKFHI